MEQIEKISFDCVLNDAVYRDFNYFTSFCHDWKKIGFLSYFPVMFFFSGLNFYYRNLPLGFLLLGAAVVVPVLYVLFWRHTQKALIARYGLDGENPPRYTLEFTGDQVTVVNGPGKLEYGWSQLFGVYCTRRYYFIYVTRSKGFVLPKSVCSQKQIRQVEKLFREKLDERRIVEVADRQL